MEQPGYGPVSVNALQSFRTFVVHTTKNYSINMKVSYPEKCHLRKWFNYFEFYFFFIVPHLFRRSVRRCCPGSCCGSCCHLCRWTCFDLCCSSLGLLGCHSSCLYRLRCSSLCLLSLVCGTFSVLILCRSNYHLCRCSRSCLHSAEEVNRSIPQSSQHDKRI